MRALAREQGRFVSRAGLRKVAGPSDGHYALIIVDSNGCPVSALTEWYRLRRQSGSPGTRRTYLGFLLPFFGYLLAHVSSESINFAFPTNCATRLLQS